MIRLKLTALIAVALLGFGATSASAQDATELVREAADALASGDEVRFEQLSEEISSLAGELPITITQALEEADSDGLAMGAEVLALADDELYVRALETVKQEQSHLPDPSVTNPDSSPSSSPSPAHEQMRNIDREGYTILQVLDMRGLEVPASAREVLSPMPRPGSGTIGPRPVTFEVARRELQELLPDRQSPASTTSRWFVVLPAAAASALGIGAWYHRRNRTLARLAATDGLTGLKNRRQLDLDFDAEARHGDRPTSLLMIDIDHFKQFNDEHGHAQGDAVLRQVGRLISDNVRADDVPYRYGGEEFCVLLPRTDEHAAAALAERVGAAIATIELNGARVTASIGVASGHAREVFETVSDADRALYVAKESGRNRVVRARG